jgi:hypothetical protein
MYPIPTGGYSSPPSMPAGSPSCPGQGSSQVQSPGGGYVSLWVPGSTHLSDARPKPSVGAGCISNSATNRNF